jgi:hypothetical protein
MGSQSYRAARGYPLWLLVAKLRAPAASMRVGLTSMG